MNILSGDPPRGRALQILLMLIILALALAPFLFPGAKPLNVAAKTCVMILLVASYDLLLGYTGIVSFAHVMFFGVGAYGIGLALYGLGASWGAIVLGLVAAELISNSYRHAFPGGKGTISVALQQSPSAGEATLTLRDDGVGLTGYGDGNRHGLGLVDRLMEQIRGTAEVRSDRGTAWTLSFPLRRDEGSGRPLVGAAAAP